MSYTVFCDICGEAYYDASYAYADMMLCHDCFQDLQEPTPYGKYILASLLTFVVSCGGIYLIEYPFVDILLAITSIMGGINVVRLISYWHAGRGEPT